ACAGRRGGPFGNPRNSERQTRRACAMTAIIPASVWRHQRAEKVVTKGDPDRIGRLRVMLAMLGFAGLYGVLAVRLMLLGIGAHGSHEDETSFIRPASQARPD